MNKNFTIDRVIKIIIVLLILIIVFVISLSSFVLELLNMKKPVAGIDSSDDKKTEKTVNFPVQQPIELPKVIYNLSGRIIAIGEDFVVFNAAILSKDSNGEIVNDAESKKATLSPTTAIKRLTFANNSPIESLIKFTDLKAGDYIEVISDQDISDAAEFTATQITILP